MWSCQPGEPLATQRLLQPTGDQGVGEQRRGDGHERGAHDDEHHGPQPQPADLFAEVEVAEADGGHRLGREVHRVEQAHVGAVGLLVRGHENRDRDHAQHEKDAERDAEGAVHRVGHRCESLPRAPAKVRADGVLVLALGLEPDAVVVIAGADQRHRSPGATRCPASGPTTVVLPSAERTATGASPPHTVATVASAGLVWVATTNS